jgi:transcriptional regulator with XRE-family HTH domain
MKRHALDHAALRQPLPPDEFGRRVVKLRKKARLRQVDLAEKVGLHRADLCKIEKGRGPENPSSATILRFADALGVTPNELMV